MKSLAAAASAELVRADLLRVEPVLEFTHPVVRAAIYEMIGPVERAEAHRRAADVLAKAGAELGDYGTPVIEGGLALGEMVLSRLERLQVYLGAVEHPGVNAIVEPHRRFVAF